MRPVFDWNDLRYFLAVARSGSTHAAAKALGVSQPTVQRRLAALEAELGRKLFERRPTGYHLTKLGDALLPDVERIEDDVAAFGRHLLSSEEGLTGVVRVTCAEAMAPRFITPLAAEFEAAHPGLKVELIMTDRYLDLAKGEADIAVRANSTGEGALVCRKVADVPWTLYASRSYLDRRGRPQSLADVAQHAVIAFAGEMANSHAGLWLQAAAPGATVAAQGNTMLGIVAAVKSGAGVAPLPMMLGEPEDDLVRLFEPVPDINSRIYLVTHQDLRASPRVRAFFDFVIAHADRFRRLLRGEVHGREC
jgi:DNA-binding transcriptional LysR family regulator